MLMMRGGQSVAMRAFGLLLLASSVLAGTKQLYFGGGLTILTKNELDAAPNDNTSAILIHIPSQYYATKISCTLLSETPWNPDTSAFNTTLNTALPYQTSYLSLFPPDQLFWVSKANDTDETCRALSANGTLATNLDCRQTLPSLCTQSAPLSKTGVDNNTTPYHIQHVVGTRKLTGYRDLHVFKFRGVRYTAGPPARFTYARVADMTTPTADAADMDVDATVAGADCSQPVGEVKNGSSEDCLFANVWTPYLPQPMADGTIPTKGLKPVMLYLYGGGFTSGSGKNPNTDGTNMASRGDAVVVSVNYRVGSIGFLAFNDGVHKGNYALSDMVAALEWVQKYIVYFGGDPQRVTIFGESAGGASVHVLLGSPKAKGLFHRAIMQSSPDGYPNNGKPSWPQYDTVEGSYERNTKKVLNLTGCLGAKDEIGCLGNITGFDLVNLTTNVNSIVVDGTYLTDHELVVNQTAASLATNVSVMAGFNRDEFGVLIDQSDYPSNGTTLKQFFTDKIGKHFSMSVNQSAALLQQVLSYSPNGSSTALAAGDSDIATLLRADSPGTPAQIFNASMRLATAAEFTCLSQAKAYSGALHSAFRTAYSFGFNRTYNPSGYTRTWCDAPKTDARPHGDPDGEYFKCHAGEQMVVFGTVRRAGLPDRDGLDGPFMRLVVDYWSAFARTGDPNPERAYLVARGYLDTLAQVEKTGRWEAVSADKPMLRLLQWNGGQVPFIDQGVCKALGLPMTVLEAAK